MIFLEYPKCSTCQKAKKFLDENKIKYQDRNIKTENPSVSELKEWYQKSGLELKKFFNTSGLVYKSLNLKEKLKEMTEEEMQEILASDGMLVKRPMIMQPRSMRLLRITECGHCWMTGMKRSVTRSVRPSRLTAALTCS